MVLLTCLIHQLPTPFVVCGEFNGHSITWGCDKNNSRGDRIYDFITDINVCLLNDGSYTYLHPATGTFTAIDLSLCSLKIRMDIDFMVESDTYDSDHFPIVVNIGVSLPIHYPVEILVGLTGCNLIKQKKRCKPWFNTECKDVMKARKTVLMRFKTNITTENQVILG